MSIDPGLFEENERTAPSGDERQYASVGALDCEAGGHLDAVTVAYETWGDLNASKDNAVLICHALSGDSHAIGWWDRLIGPGKAFDTERYFVIGTNALGGCQGTTGPASLDPEGSPYRTRFPQITVRDMVDVQVRLMDQLGIEQLLAVAGGSMGGMQAVEWTVRYPGRVRKAFLTATASAHSAMQIGFNEAGRQAIMRDPRWRGGEYPLEDPPSDGLSVARMIGHLSFLSDAAFTAKFGRRLQGFDKLPFKFGTEFQIESYLSYQGDKFTKRFDANSLLYLTKAIDRYECMSLAGSTTEYLIVSFTSDWIYPTHQSVELERLAREAGCKAVRVEIDVPYGHDAFLLEEAQQGALVREFLAGS
jgi:homoserine O-acetyltransferase/O-succinyltransferase